MQTPYSSAQRAELQALVCALLHFAHDPVSSPSDGACATGAAVGIDTATIGYTQPEELFHVFHTLQKNDLVHRYPCCMDTSELTPNSQTLQ